MADDDKVNPQFVLAYVTRSFEYAKKAARDGYYIEAITRVDIFIDTILYSMLRISCKTEGEMKLLDAFEKELGPALTKKVNRILVERGVITHSLANQTDRFKEKRNTLVHDLMGTMELMRKQNIKHATLDPAAFEKGEKAALELTYKEGILILEELIRSLFKYKGVVAPKFSLG